MSLVRTIRDTLVHEVNEPLTAYNEPKTTWHAATYCGLLVRWLGSSMPGVTNDNPVVYVTKVDDPHVIPSCLGCVTRTFIG